MNEIKVKGRITLLTNDKGRVEFTTIDEATISLTPQELLEQLTANQLCHLHMEIEKIINPQPPQDKDLKKLCEATQDGTLKEMFKKQEYCSCPRDYKPGDVIKCDEVFPVPICAKCHLPIRKEPPQKYCSCEKPKEDFNNGVHPHYCFCGKPLPPAKKIEELKTSGFHSPEEYRLIDKLNEVIRLIREERRG